MQPGRFTPISRYSPSMRTYPAVLPAIEYGAEDEVVTVKWNGELRYKGRQFKVSSALHRHQVAVRPRQNEDGVYDIFYSHHHCGSISFDET